MNAESAEFVDSNIFVCAFDASAGSRHISAERLVERIWQRETGCLSLQVLQEFFITVTRKTPLPLSVDEAAQRVREFAAWRVFLPTVDDVPTPSRFKKKRI